MLTACGASSDTEVTGTVQQNNPQQPDTQHINQSVSSDGEYELTNNSTSALGTNTNSIRDYGTNLPFIDIFKTARHFSEVDWLTDGNVQYDSQGWPTDLGGGRAGVLMLTQFEPGMAPSGHYTVLYEGDGDLQYQKMASLVSHQPGRDIIDVQLDRDYAIELLITRSNPGNPVRNIHVLLPGGVCASDITARVDGASACPNNDYLSFEDNYEQLLFNPAYLDYMKDFKVIRFMDMMRSNDSDVKDWSDWVKYDDAVWSSKIGDTPGQNRTGVPVEVMVKLANIVNADPWFTLPHQASDDFNRRFASYVRDNLKPTLQAHIEYSNEVWNGIFDQYDYAKARGQQLNLDADANIAGYKYYARRSVEIFRLWEDVFGGTARLKRIIGSHAARTYLSDTYLSYENTAQYTDALAIAPYFGGDIGNISSIRSVEEVFSALENTYTLASDTIEAQFTKASEYGVELVAYEGGQHLVDWNTSSNEDGPNPYLFAANRDPRMGVMYDRYLRDWKNMGGHTFVQFTSPRKWGRSGSWGIKEYLTQPANEAPKYTAVVDFIHNNPVWW